MHIFTHIHIYTHTCIYIHTYINTCIHTYIHAYIHTYIHTYIYTYTHTYIHTYIYTYIHTYIQGPQRGGHRHTRTAPSQGHFCNCHPPQEEGLRGSGRGAGECTTRERESVLWLPTDIHSFIAKGNGPLCRRSLSLSLSLSFIAKGDGLSLSLSRRCLY